MDAKITLSFNADVIADAKKFAEAHQISLSRLTEFIYSQLSVKNYQSLDELPISDWVNIVSDGGMEYKTEKRTRKSLKSEYYKSKK